MLDKPNVKENLKEPEMGYDIVEDIKRAKANISLFEMCNVPQKKEKLLKALEVPKEELPTNNQPAEEIVEASVGGKTRFKTPPFLLTFEILNHNVHNCLVDLGSTVNVMTLSVCKRINGQPKPTTWQVTQLDRTNVKVVGEMEDVLILLSENEKICQYINIVVANIPDAYGPVLNRDWSARLNGYFASDWSHLWLPHKGSTNQIKILREPQMKHNVYQLEEKNEPVNSVLGNYFIELELRNYQAEEANGTPDTQPNLLRFSRDDEIDCKLVDVVLDSSTIELDNG